MKPVGAVELILRSCVFSYVLYAYMTGVPLSDYLGGTFALPAVIWLVFMLSMAAQLLPGKLSGVPNNKQFKKIYLEPKGGYDRGKLAENTRVMNRRAAGVLAFWLCLNAAAIILYITGVIDADEIIMLVMVYYLCDALCMAIWCPLQKLFMKSRCCADCRIYGWGYFLVFAPLLVIPCFYTATLAAMAFALLLRWEIRYAAHPERFFPDSNAAINCKYCAIPKCRVSGKLKRAVSKRRALKIISSRKMR